MTTSDERAFWGRVQGGSSNGRRPGDPREPGNESESRYGSSLVDWETFWSKDRRIEDFLIAPILVRGRSHATYSPAKVGKSLVALDVAARAATGQRVLDQPAGDPLNVSISTWR